MDKYLGYLKRGNKHYFEDGNSIVSGRVKLDVFPSIAAEKLTCFRLEIPAERTRDELPFIMALVLSVLENYIDEFSEVFVKIGSAMMDFKTISEPVGPWRFETRINDTHDQWLVVIEAMPA